MNRALLAIGALALGAAASGCSSGANDFGFDDSGGGGAGGSADGGSSGASSGGSGSSSSSSGGSGSSSGGSSGSSSGGSSGSSSGGSSGSSSGSGGGADAGNQGTADAGGTRPDATASQDAGGIADTGAVNLGPDSGLCADQAAWLDPQNAARAAVNAGEPPLVCDPIAVQVALNYAKTCVFAHNANRSAQYVALGGTGGLGENIAAGAPTESIANAVASWVNEGVNYNHATNTCAAGQVCGHYTQVVWKATTRVGCAHVSCTTNSPFGAGFANGMWDNSVCDYAPPGNFVGQSPY